MRQMHKMCPQVFLTRSNTKNARKQAAKILSNLLRSVTFELAKTQPSTK